MVGREVMNVTRLMTEPSPKGGQPAVIALSEQENKAYVDGKPCHLTAQEYRLLPALACLPGCVLSHEKRLLPGFGIPSATARAVRWIRKAAPEAKNGHRDIRDGARHRFSPALPSAPGYGRLGDTAQEHRILLALACQPGCVLSREGRI